MVRVTPGLTSRKVLDITYQTPQETLLGTPVTLPTSEPGTPQVSYTVASGDLPTLSITPFSKTWISYVYAAGKFVTAGILSWRMKKNGSSVRTGTLSVAANTYYTLTACFFNIAVGDVLEIALWSNQTDSNYDYKAFFVVVDRVSVWNKRRLYAPCNFTGVEAKPVLTLGNPSVQETKVTIPYHLDIYLYYNFSAPTNFSHIYAGTTYGCFMVGLGDYSKNNDAYGYTHASYRPYYVRQSTPTQIVIRGAIID